MSQLNVDQVRNAITSEAWSQQLLDDKYPKTI